MADYVAGFVSYPNLNPLISCEYTCSHGISPGTIVIRTHPGGPGPVPGGQVTIGDNRKSFNVRACKLERFEQTRSDSGIQWVLTLSDGRWRWKDGVINGVYNQLDPHGKLIPRTVRSPTELAILCLQAMGVDRFVVDMPDGIPGAAVAAIPEFLDTGVNFPQIGINPPVNWYAANPASMLSQLAEQCGRNIVYDVVTDTVLVVRPGIGNDIPNGHVANVTPSLSAPETPDAVSVVGDPTHYQGMFELYAVGLEWDGTLRPINQLSYAPALVGKKMIVEVTVTEFNASSSYAFRVEGDGLDRTVSYTTSGSGTVNDVATGLAAAVNAEAGFSGKLTASAAGAVVTLTGVQAGFAFGVTLIHTDRMSVRVNQQAMAGGFGWEMSPPPLFPGIRETARLTRLQAIALAQKSVFRMYRLTGRDVTTGRAPIVVPGYGNAVRQDIVLLDERVEQVVPEDGDRRFIDTDGNALIRNVYDGFSRSKPPAVYGSVMRQLLDNGSMWFVGNGQINQPGGVNTEPSDQVYADFSVNPTFQCITFSSYMYESGGGLICKEPKLWLECGCQVRDAVTQQFAAYTDSVRFRPGPAVQVVRKEDVQLNVIGTYTYSEGTKTWRLTKTRLLEADAVLRARYYLQAALAQFQVKGAVTVEFNGIEPVSLDGNIAQVTWSIIGGVGIKTTVSKNMEHSTWMQAYPARRRAENLAPIARRPGANGRGNLADPGVYGGSITGGT